MPQQKATSRPARRGSGGVTLNDVSRLPSRVSRLPSPVSRLAGVSAITVSRALNTLAMVSPEAREKVRRAVELTGYVPNLLAGGLASNRSRLVAALVPTIAGPVFLETIQSLTEALAGEGYQLMLGQSGYNNGREDALIDAIIGRRPDGIVLTGIMRSAEGRRRLLASGIPVVETWDLTPTPIDMLVGFSHEKVGQETARFLHARGYRRPALVTGDDQRAARRSASFGKTMAELGLDPVPVRTVAAPTTLGHGRAALAELLRDDPRCDVVVCSSDGLAHGVIIEAQSRRRQAGRAADRGHGLHHRRARRRLSAREDLDQFSAFDDPHHPQRRGIESVPPGHVLVLDCRGETRRGIRRADPHHAAQGARRCRPGVRRPGARQRPHRRDGFPGLLRRRQRAAESVRNRRQSGRHPSAQR